MKVGNVWTVANRDFKSYFTSPIAYIVIAGFMVIMGWMFFFNLSHFNMQNMQYQQFNMGKGREHYRRHHPSALREYERNFSLFGAIHHHATFCGREKNYIRLSS